MPNSRPTVAKEPPAPWIAAIDPSPDWTLARSAREADWEIEARWWGYADDPAGPPTGPREVVISALTPEARKRGVTSGVMRRMERLLAELVAEVTSTSPDGPSPYEQAVGWGVTMALTNHRPSYEEALAARVAELPKGGPRATPDEYYGALLNLFDLVAATNPQPVNTLAAAMGVPRGTLNTRLATARRLRNREARRREASG